MAGPACRRLTGYISMTARAETGIEGLRPRLAPTASNSLLPFSQVASRMSWTSHEAVESAQELEESPQCIVELRSVSKRYGEHPALEDFSLQVRRGEFLTLLGPSGSGKTTILRLVAGFEQPQSGQILINGRDASPLRLTPTHVRTSRAARASAWD